MKKLIISFLFFIILPAAISQDTIQMDISQIPNEVGVLYEKGFIDIGNVNRGVEVQILEVKNLIEEKVSNFVRIQYKTAGTYGCAPGRTFVFALNKEETESLITAMDKMIEIINNKKNLHIQK